MDKRDINTLPYMEGWIARDQDGLWFLYDKPERDDDGILLAKDGRYINLDTELMPELANEDDPVEVELLIRKL